MSKTMPKSTKEEKYRWIKPILDQEITIKQMVKVCPFSERALKYWLANFRDSGLTGLENKSTRPKSQPNETPISVKERIIELRQKTNLCAKKLNYKLKKENILIDDRTIGKIIKTEGLVRKYRVRKLKYAYIKVPVNKGELVEIDIKYVPQTLENKRYYQYTAIDCASRWRHLKIYEEQSNHHSIVFLKEVIRIFPYKIEAVKTDNGFVFTNLYTGTYKRADLLPRQPHSFDRFCHENNIIHYLIDRGKPAQNGTVERSHRTDQEQFYEMNKFSSLKDLERKIQLWNMYYNGLEHCGLKGKSPNQFLSDYQLTNPPKVCA